MILKQGHTYRAMPHDGKVIRRIYRGGRCYYKDSPYSLAATQALKAAFPQYWTAIRDYGYAHPAIVPFVNEDPMLIVSLVEVGKTRWLVGDGKAKIDLGRKYGTGAKARLRFKYHNEPINDRNLLAGNGVQFIHYNNWLYYQYSSWNSTNTKIEEGNVYDIETSFGNPQYMKINGEIKKTTSIGGNFMPTTNTHLFDNGATTTAAEFDANLCEMYEGEELVQHLVPCQTNDQGAGMLDIVSLTFHPNANTEGTFTIEITDK